MKIIVDSLLGIAFILFGELLAYYVFTSIEQGGFFLGLLGITAFVVIITGIVFLLMAPFKFFFRTEDIINEKPIWYKYSIRILSYFLGIAPFMMAGLIFYHYTRNYHDSQLEQFGVVKQVLIDGEIKGKNGRNDLTFSFLHNGRKWSGSEDKWKYKIGDSVPIIYSSQNPNELEWYRKYLEDMRLEEIRREKKEAK